MTKEENPIGYQFTPVPTNLIFMLDPSCFKLMSLLIQEESYQKAKNNVKNKCFPEAIKRLSLRIPMCEKDVKLTIQSLEEASLIEVIEQGQYHKPNLFKINWDKIKEVDQICVTDLTNDVVPMICKKKRPTSKDKKDLAESTLEENVSIENINESASGENEGQSGGQSGGQVGRQSNGESDTPLLNNTDNSNNINNIDNNIINNNIINNQVIEKESSHSLNTSIGEKEQLVTNLNGEQIVNASAPQAAAHGIDSTGKINTNEELLIMEFYQAFKGTPYQEFRRSLEKYTTEELKHIQEQLPALGLKGHDVDGFITFLIAIRNRKAA
ncbi:MAG: hypothetical protein M0P26_05350 [Bacteroidales bacterium]|nr:hypothetical protein [Bacteroidales bacterium]